MSAAVLTIIDSPETSPTRAYAERCWQNDPRIHPAWWREILGMTAAKLVLDWRHSVYTPECLCDGFNTLLLRPTTLPLAADAIEDNGLNWHEIVTLLVVDAWPEKFDVWPTALVLDVSPYRTPDEAMPFIVAAETAVRDGLIAFYGVAHPDLSSPHPIWPLHIWITAAEEAAQQVWGRKKRSGLRMVLLMLDMAHPSALLMPTTQHKHETVSTMELAARLGWYVLAAPGAWFIPALMEHPLSALCALAEAETQLIQKLGGWPQTSGKPWFSGLRALQLGQTPWPTYAAGLAWQYHVFPNLFNYLEQLTTTFPAHYSVIQNYRQCLSAIAPHAPFLGGLHALTRHPYFAPYPHDNLLLAQTLAATPGVGGTLIPQIEFFTNMKYINDLPDVYAAYVPE